MIIKGQCHSWTLVQGHSISTFSNFFSLETAESIEAKFHVKPQWHRRMKVCSNDPGYMTNMAVIPIYDKNLKIFFSATKTSMTLRFSMQHRVLEYHQVCSNDDSGLTLTYFTAIILWEKDKTIDFSEN